MKYLITLILIAGIFVGAMAQNVSGHWKGRITQFDGGFRSEYIIELWLEQRGDSIVGKSYVFVDEIYAQMEISGKVDKDGNLFLHDDRIVAAEVLQGMEWCIKNYILQVRRNGNDISVEGDWNGKTNFSNCIPGKIFLRKAEPRA